MPAALLPRPAPSPSPPDNEFTFSHADFERVRALIYRHAGISLHDGKRAMVYSRLTRRLRDSGERGFGAYLRRLDSLPAGHEQWQEFVNCLTTNLTAFFREDHHFVLLVEDLQGRRGGPIRMWCAAASTGEEPYSLAMTVQETLGSGANLTLLASDIDTAVLATARRAVYETDARGLSPERLRRHFQRGTGVNAGHIRVKPELARLVEFRSFNLMSADWSSLGGPMDIVFCRNVMIYFDAPTQRRVLEQIHRATRPGAMLYVGHSENFTESRDLFRLRGKTVYERV